jgi:hypothetical protein
LQFSIGICHSSTDSQFIFSNDLEAAPDPVQMSWGFMESVDSSSIAPWAPSATATLVHADGQLLQISVVNNTLEKDISEFENFASS